MPDDASLDALCATLDIPRQDYADHEEARGLYAPSQARRLSFACAYAAQRYQAADQAADLIERERWLGVHPGPRREERRQRKAATMKRAAEQAVTALERARRV